eukprot:1795131-Prorocentrum_lima.AAC.1
MGAAGVDPAKAPLRPLSVKPTFPKPPLPVANPALVPPPPPGQPFRLGGAWSDWPWTAEELD